MYTKKVPKSQTPDTSWYTIHRIHDGDYTDNWKQRKDYYYILSIDPGKRNFCIRIEYRDLLTGKIVSPVFEKIDIIGKEAEDHLMLIDSTYLKITNFLDKYIDTIKKCHIILIERQLSINYKMIRLSQHVISYMSIKLKDNPNLPVLIEVSPKLKSGRLGAPKGLSPKDIKKWAVVKALELLEIREDNKSIKSIQSAKGGKKDDFADTIVQIEAFFSLLELPLTRKVIPISIDMGSLSLVEAKPAAVVPRIDLGLLLNLDGICEIKK